MAQALPFIAMGASALGGALSSAGAGSGTYNSQAIGNPGDVVNTNPMTQNAWNRFLQNLGQYSPTQNVSNLQGVTPGIQSIVSNIISPYSQGLNETARLMGDQAQRELSRQYSDAGALNSGAALSAIARGYAEPISQATTNIAGMQSQLGGGIAQSLLGQMGASYGGSLSGLAQYGMPEWWQPQYQTTYQPGILEIIGSALGMGGGAMGGLGSLFGLGGSGGGGQSSGGVTWQPQR